MLYFSNFYLSQVQQWSGVWNNSHVGISGAADQDPATDTRSNDHRQSSDRWSAGAAGGGMYIQDGTSMSFYKGFTSAELQFW